MQRKRVAQTELSVWTWFRFYIADYQRIRNPNTGFYRRVVTDPNKMFICKSGFHGPWKVHFISYIKTMTLSNILIPNISCMETAKWTCIGDGSVQHADSKNVKQSAWSLNSLLINRNPIQGRKKLKKFQKYWGLFLNKRDNICTLIVCKAFMIFETVKSFKYESEERFGEKKFGNDGSFHV